MSRKFSYNSSPTFVELKLLKDFVLHNTNGKLSHLELVNKGFDKKKGFIIFFSESCPHCKSFMPTILNLSKSAEAGIGMINVDDVGSGNNILADFFKITGVPMIKFYDGNTYLDYEGPRTVNDMLKFATSIKVK